MALPDNFPQSLGDFDVTPGDGDPTKPLVLLIHGTSGNKFDMTAPDNGLATGGTNFNFNYNAPMQPDRDLGWSGQSIIWGIHHFELDQLKPVTSWRQALQSNGYRTACYSQVDPAGFLARPVQELGKVMSYLRSTFPGTRIVLLGHSRGGLLIRKFIKQNAANRSLIGSIAGVITLHSPHHGSHLASIASAINNWIDSVEAQNPLMGLVLEPLLRNQVNSPAFQEMAVNGPFLNDLQAGEQPLPGVVYHTFGGTSVKLTRLLNWVYSPISSVPQWHWPPFHHIIFQDEAWLFSPLINGLPQVPFEGMFLPEFVHGMGDVLTADEGARLPFATHHTNAINHGEALWDPNLQQQVLGVLAGIRPSRTSIASYGRTIKVSHLLTANTLHSHAINYGHPGTSGQQQVTAFPGYDDNDLWRVLGPAGDPRSGQPVQHGQVLRLEHVLTQRNLHSHPGIPSPVTGQQEVTCFGSNGTSDSNDHWRIEIEGGGNWEFGKRARLIHINTNRALHSHAGFSHPQWTMGQQEVTGFPARDDNDWWSLFEVR